MAAQGPRGQFAAELSCRPCLPAPELVLHLASCCLGGLVPPRCVFSGTRAQVRNRKAPAERSALGAAGTPGFLGLCWLWNWADVSLCHLILQEEVANGTYSVVLSENSRGYLT